MMAWSWNRFMEPASADCVSLRSRDPMPTGSSSQQRRRDQASSPPDSKRGRNRRSIDRDRRRRSVGHGLQDERDVVVGVLGLARRLREMNLTNGLRVRIPCPVFEK